MNDFIELRQVTTIILRRWWLLVLLIAVGAMGGYAISRGQKPVYQATTTVLVGESIKSSSVDRVDIQISEALIQTYVEIASRQPVLQGVVTTLNLGESWQDLKKQVTVNPIENTQLIEIVVEANSPELAQRIADEIVNQLILLSPSSSQSTGDQSTNSFNHEQIINLQGKIVEGQKRLAEIETSMNNSISEVELAALQSEKATLEGLIIEWERNYTQLLALNQPKRDPTQLTVVEPAHSNNRMIRPRIQLNTILGGGVGMVVALALIFLLNLVDDTYRSLKDFSQPEEANILGSIRRIKGRKFPNKLIAQLQPHSPITESYRIIRSRIRFRRADNPARSIMVTSSMPEEGKSVTAANLAVVFAQANFKTVIVDADLRHPVLHEIFDVINEIGLGDVLSSQEMTVEECLTKTSVENLQILTSGKALADPSSQLGSERMSGIIMELKNVADIVIFDSPPVLIFADALVLSRRIDGVIMVIQAGKSKRRAVNQTLLDLQNANPNLLGSVFNQAPKSDTFSVNKVYMQERPPLPFARALLKKESQFHSLRDSAVPLSKNLESPGLVSEKDNTGEGQIHSLDDSTMPAIENFEISASDNGSKGPKFNIPHDVKDATKTNHVKPLQVLDMDDSVTLADENLAMPSFESEKASIEEMQIHDLGDSATFSDEDLEMSGLAGEEAGIEEMEIDKLGELAVSVNADLAMPALADENASIDETQIQDLTDSEMPSTKEVSSLDSEIHVDEKAIDVQHKRKRHRKSKRNVFQSEGVSADSSNAPIEETHE